MPDISSKIMKRQDKVLIVEGKKDQFVIANFMELAGISWPKNSPPVHIQDSGGSDKVPKITENILKGDAWTHVGIVIDADNDANTSWTTLQKKCDAYFPGIPIQIPNSGHWHGKSSDKKLGIWIMPGKSSKGMLEDFLVDCMIHENNSDHLWEFAKSSTLSAKSHQASYKDVHQTKAQIHCWLAWQHEPGNQLHQAMNKRFNPNRGLGPDFVNWFRDVFEP